MSIGKGTIVILTGAGISAESGLATFRDAGGLWCGHKIEEVATPEGYRANPELVHEFYNARRRALKEALPNAAHLAVAMLMRQWQGEVVLVTQNVDDLHQRAAATHSPREGSGFYPMHGELRKVRCAESGRVHDWEEDCTRSSVDPVSGERGRLRPHIVWFGEMPMYMDEIMDVLARADLFLSIGTSGSVYPAAGFVADLKHWGRAHTVELNLEPSKGSEQFDEQHYGPASRVVTDYVAKILAGEVI